VKVHRSILVSSLLCEEGEEMQGQHQYEADVARGGCYSYIAPFMKYNSVKYIQVYDWRLAMIQYGLQIAILIYVIGFTVIYERGYQGSGLAITSITTKVKGATTSTTGMIYDANDLIVPPTEPNAMFVTLNYIATPSQTRGICQGLNDTEGECKHGCVAGKYTYNGVLTGNCSTNGTFCEVKAWCPVEDEDAVTPVYFDNNIASWTIFIRTNAYWPDYNYGRSNTEGTTHPTYNVSLWSLQDLVARTGNDFSKIQKKGAIVLVSAKFDCNLDNKKDDCEPTFSFSRYESLFCVGLTSFSA
jgi:P2X purinoceptor 4